MFFRSYISSRYQRCKINNSFIWWKIILAGVPEGSILGPLLFKVSINDIFLFPQQYETANYADDCTIYSSHKNITSIMTSLNHDFAILSNWFKIFMVLNPDKCCFMLCGVKDLVFSKVTIEISREEKVLGITFDNTFDFSSHLTGITKKANIKLNNLTRVQKYTTPE